MRRENIQPIIAMLTDDILRRLGEEVEIVFQYGSFLHGATNKYSDVDLSYVPRHEDTWESITVMVDDVLCDLYPMHWSKLERMAEFRDVSASVLLHHRIVYRRSEAAADRFRALAARLEGLLLPAARPEMQRRAQEIFQSTAYDYYLLRRQVEAGHQAGCARQAQAILRTVLHCLAVYNQACVDTRKVAQVLALPHLPAGFAETAERLINAWAPHDLLTATDALLQTTRDLLLAGQRQHLRAAVTYPAAFESAYPEFKRDLQGIMLACERQDMFALKTSLFSLLHELSRAIAEVETAVSYSGFNGLDEYEQDLAALGFPPLLPAAAAGDFAALHRQCQAFDGRLQTFLTGRGVALNTFATPAALHAHLHGKV